MKKRAILFTCLIIVFLAIGLILVKKIGSLPETPTREKLIDFFVKNETVFKNIANHLKTVEGDVLIDKRNGNDVDSIARITTKDGVKSFIMEDSIKNDVLKLLYQFGFSGIYKESDFIYFNKSIGFQWFQALIYSESGKKPPLHRERDFVEIGNGWYYYYGE